jgi:hypothetical protein
VNDVVSLNVLMLSSNIYSLWSVMLSGDRIVNTSSLITSFIGSSDGVSIG